MRLELTRVGLLAELANHYTTRGASEEETCELFVCLFLWQINTCYLMPNSPYTYILNTYYFGLLEFYGISTIVGYLTPTRLYTNIGYVI